MRRFNFSFILLITIVLLEISTLKKTNAQSLGDCSSVGTVVGGSSVPRGLDCSNSSSDWTNKYRTPGFWAPADGSSIPVKTILVNIVVCQNDYGSGGWVDSPILRHDIDLMFEAVNQRYSNSQPKDYVSQCEPSVTEIVDSRIRFELNEIIFIPNSTLHVLDLCGTGQVIDWLEMYHPTAKNAFNHIFTMPSGGCASFPASVWGYYGNDGGYSFVHTRGSMFWPEHAYWEEHVDHWAHEYGHAVGLHHMYDSEYTTINHPDFLNDVFGNCSEPAEENGSLSYFSQCGVNECGDGNDPCPCPCDNDFDYDQVCYLKAFWSTVPPYYAKPLMAGGGNCTYISPKSMGRMHRALSLFNNAFIIDNTNMHKYVKEKYPYYLPHEVSVNETWDFSIKMYQNILVKAGATLTIKCEVRMPIDGQIIVEQGAKLIIDGGVITAAHSERWDGIKVYGNKNQHQFAIGGNYNQGYLELKNGAIIENCVTGVTNYQPSDPNTSGGIVKATDATFKNVKVGVDFTAYQNFRVGGVVTNPSDWRANVSFFNNCTFELAQPALNPFDCCIKLYKVDGIKIIGCTFKPITPTATTVAGLGIGIKALDANFLVSEKCLITPPIGMPCTGGMDKTEFINLKAGIWATKSTGSYNYSVQNSQFTNCQIGILNDGVSNAWITDNQFTIGNTPNAISTTPQIGIDLANNILGFKVENNDITESTSPPPLGTDVTIGIWSYNTGTNNNSIYLNKMHYLDRAIQSEKLNKQTSNIPTATGLALRCNQMDNGKYDIIVPFTSSSGDPNGPYYGIKPNQGSSTLPAGNTFSNNVDLANDEFYNYTGYYGLTYYYKTGIAGENPNNVLNVTKIPLTTPTNYCQPTYGGGGSSSFMASSPTLTKSEAENQYDLFNGLYLVHDLILNDLKDDGNTNALKNEVANALPSDAFLLRLKLLLTSPYLSEDVLKSVADRTDIFSDAVIKDIIAANPDAITNPVLVKYLEEKNDPLPEWIIDILVANCCGNTDYTELSSKISDYQEKRDEAIYTVIDYILSDENGVNHSELRTWLSRLNNPQADYQIVQSYIHTGDHQNAVIALDNIESNYSLDSYVKEDYQNFKSLIEFYVSIKGQGLDWPHLNTEQVDQLKSIADQSEYTGSSMAKNVLNFFYGYDYWIEPDLSPLLSTPKNTSITGLNAEEDIINLYPNPANESFTIDYIFNQSYSDLQLIVVDELGRPVMQKVLNPGKVGIEYIETNSWNAGIYQYQIIANKVVIKNGKLVIAH